MKKNVLRTISAVIRTREIFAGLLFFVLVAGGSLFYSWQTRRASQEVLDRQMQRLNHKAEDKSAEQVNTQPSIEPLKETAVPVTVDTTITGSEKEDTADVDLADTVVSTETDSENETPDSYSADKTKTLEDSSEDLEKMTSAQLEERKKAEAVIKQFLESQPDMEIPIEAVLKNPAIAAKIKSLNVRLEGPGRLHVKTPEEVSDALSTLNENE